MNVESIYPFLLIIAPFAMAFLLEALVLSRFKVGSFWACLGVSLPVNLLSLVILYVSSLFLSRLNYEFNGLQLPLQVTIFLWWLSVLIDSLLLPLFFRRADRRTVFLAS